MGGGGRTAGSTVAGRTTAPAVLRVVVVGGGGVGKSALTIQFIQVLPYTETPIVHLFGTSSLFAPLPSTSSPVEIPNLCYKLPKKPGHTFRAASCGEHPPPPTKSRALCFRVPSIIDDIIRFH
ncbi:hypothetical protein ANCCEY_07536 [Ancylostoma ceylanicum]|uniref:Ras family protein n=1 Tax=Ancylostoma ceylanicum TaxID=53326 RepID=A0A0D6LTK9_9BILA|nr:hypothetical protein ANCCEY_07536 [Ancylostoma ceylanicum]